MTDTPGSTDHLTTHSPAGVLSSKHRSSSSSTVSPWPLPPSDGLPTPAAAAALGVEEPAVVAAGRYHVPQGLDLAGEAGRGLAAWVAAQGLKAMPYMAEIYPVGGEGHAPCGR